MNYMYDAFFRIIFAANLEGLRYDVTRMKSMVFLFPVISLVAVASLPFFCHLISFCLCLNVV